MPAAQVAQAGKGAHVQPASETFEQYIAEALADPAPISSAAPARLLIVQSDQKHAAALLSVLGGWPAAGQREFDQTPAGAMSAISALSAPRSHHSPGHRCTLAASLKEARTALSRTRFDVIILDLSLCDGEGLELLPLVQKISPATKTIVVAASASADEAVAALRGGAADFVLLPPDAADLARRVDSALIKSRAERQRDERLSRLTSICRELNAARHEISKQVDALCEDLATAYHDMAEQMNDVAMASEFRTLLKQELDVEDLLRTTLEYLLTKTGPTNAAVFLPDARGAGAHQNYGLGAYVNCDCPRETIAILLDHLCHAICPQMADESEIVSFSDAREFAQWIGADAGAGVLADSHVIAFSCRTDDDCLAVFVLFRNKSNPFSEKLAATIDTMRSIIAEQLSNVIKVHHRARPSWPKEARDGDLDDALPPDDEFGLGFSSA